MQQVTPDHLALTLRTSYQVAFVAVAVGLLVELICFRRLRRWNGWLTMLAGVMVCLQTVVMVIVTTVKWDGRATYEAIVRVNALGFSGVALVAIWLGLRRVWLERARSGTLLACIRAGAVGLMIYAYWIQLDWGLDLMERLQAAPRYGG
ncbi:MAG: hypothetical protein ACYTCU_03985 [Planctomycetota bacterium]|jgi:hypothetical protein